MNTVETIRKFHACDTAIEWSLSIPDPRDAWERCERGDWLLWISAELGVDRRTIVLAACACARTALQYVPPGEDRPRLAIEMVEAWCRGEATIEDVRTSSRAAYAAADADADAADAYADARAAAAAAAAYAAAYAAYAACAARAAAYSDDAERRWQADYIRSVVRNPFLTAAQAAEGTK